MPTTRADEWVGKQLFDEISHKLKGFKAKYWNHGNEIDQEARLVIAEYLEKRPEHIKNTVAYLVGASKLKFY